MHSKYPNVFSNGFGGITLKMEDETFLGYLHELASSTNRSLSLANYSVGVV